MGFLIGQMRLAQIISYRSDLEYKLQLISSTKLDLSRQVNEMISLGADMDPDSPEYKALKKKEQRLNEAEKALDLKMQRFQQQLDMINSEEQGVKQMIQQGIQRSYS